MSLVVYPNSSTGVVGLARTTRRVSLARSSLVLFPHSSSSISTRRVKTKSIHAKGAVSVHAIASLSLALACRLMRESHPGEGGDGGKVFYYSICY